MHVAVIHPKYTPFGGGARMIDDIVRTLAARGAAVTMLVRDWSGSRPEGVEIRRIDPFHLGSTWRDRGFERAMTPERLAGFDLVVSDQKIPGIDVYIAGGGCHREYVAGRRRRASGLQRLALDLNLHSRFTAAAEARLFASPRLRSVICVSERVKADLLRWYRIDPDRLHVVHNGIDTTRFDPRWRQEHRGSLRREMDLGERFTLAFVGSGFERKGLGALLRGLARARHEAVLLVVGKDRHAGRFVELARTLGIAGRCRFLGPQADVRPFYAAADATALLSSFEPFGLGPLEGLSMGLPTLVSHACGVAELIDDGRQGWRVDADDPDDVARGLDALADDPARLGPACVEQAARHSTEAMLRTMQSVFDRLLAAPTEPWPTPSKPSSSAT